VSQHREFGSNEAQQGAASTMRVTPQELNTVAETGFTPCFFFAFFADKVPAATPQEPTL